MYGFSDQAKPIPCTRLSAERQGSSRYSTGIPMAHRTEHTFATPVELEPGILRLTLPLPSGPGHVHCYFLRGDDGWTLVDTGLGLMETPWDEILAQLAGPVIRIFITHMHPDHVGGAEAAAAATGAPVFQGRLDYAQCEQVWGSDDWPEQIAAWFLRNGVPSDVADELIESGHVFADFVRFAWNPTLVEAGDELDGWRDPRNSRARRRSSRPPPRRRLDRGRHAAHADHAGDRALPREPPRPARRLPRVAAARLRAGPARVVRGPRRVRRRSGRSLRRDRPAPRAAARPHGGRPRQ